MIVGSSVIVRENKNVMRYLVQRKKCEFAGRRSAEEGEEARKGALEGLMGGGGMIPVVAKRVATDVTRVPLAVAATKNKKAGRKTGRRAVLDSYNVM